MIGVLSCPGCMYSCTPHLESCPAASHNKYRSTENPLKEPPAKDIVRHKIGCARTIRTAVSVVEYLRDKCCYPHSEIHRDSVIYEFTTPSKENGFWTADILINHDDVDNKTATEFVNTCRAFVAGAGEIW